MDGPSREIRTSFRKVVPLILLWLLLPACHRGGWNLPPAGRLSDPAIRESSGLVLSNRDDDIFWTHNDAHNPPQVFAVTRSGRTLRHYYLPCGTNHDWEDIARDGKGSLFLLDNYSLKDQKTGNLIIQFSEPDPEEDEFIHDCKVFAVRFPDGAYDCETLLVWQDKLYLVTKPWDGSLPRLYRYDRLGEDGVATFLGNVPVYAMITGGDISSDGRRVVLSSYRALMVFQGGGPIEELLTRDPIIAPLNAGQVESAAWRRDDIYLTNEQRGVFHVNTRRWREAEAPFWKTPEIHVDRSADKPDVETPLGDWEEGPWLQAHARREGQHLGRLTWTQEGLHIGIILPETLALSPSERPTEYEEWFRPGSIYIMINPDGTRPIRYGRHDRCILLGKSADGKVLADAFSLLPATLIESSEKTPSWVQVEEAEDRLLVTLSMSREGMFEMLDDREIGFNLIVINNEGRLESWAPLIQRYSWDSPSIWGLLELED